MSQYPPINAGTTPTIAVLQAMLPQNGLKSSGTPRTSTTTMTADPDLSVPVAANAKYDVEMTLVYNGAATGSGDLKFQLAGPSGATFAGMFTGIANPLATAVNSVTLSTTQVSYGNGTGNPLPCKVSGTLFTSATPGSLTLNWAQNTSSGTATTLMTGSKLSARRVG
jgi:hypothetical protein